ncbi:MAG TPA: SufD family Fe-S cluster assembly protein, partial [Gammaproteobacteria bacterium]|nr:SufD family Fe-S cluster assembly protein [Gammaproteobacteria bacterium]
MKEMLPHSQLPDIRWLRDLQINQLEAFHARGFPTRNEEIWKYTDMLALSQQKFTCATFTDLATSVDAFIDKEIIKLVFVNGYYNPNLSDLSLLPQSIELSTISKALVTHEQIMQMFLTDIDTKRYPFASLNTALMTDGMYLSLPKNCSVKTPIHCVFINTHQQEFFTCPRNIIHVGENSEATIIEEYITLDADNYLTCPVTHLYAEDNARINYYKNQAEAFGAYHVANIFIKQEQDSVIKCFSLDTGSRLAREDIHAVLQAPRAECQLHGFYHVTQDTQLIDNHVYIDHAANHGSSNMLYKGILNKKSKAVFNGKVFVKKDTEQNAARQANHNLLLSNDAEVNSKPELEIYAEDVKCTHGAT